jgi:hypothetical protein
MITDEQRARLAEPFERYLVKQRQGRGGQTFSYVSGAQYIHRLNEVFNCNWNFKILEYKLLDNDEIVVIGELTVMDGVVVKQSVGSGSVSKTRSGEIISVGDDLKAAATDALKKCCSLLGVGLHLYDYVPRQSNHSDDVQISEKQKNAILSIIKSKNYNLENFGRYVLNEFGKELDSLSMREASLVIKKLNI